MAGIRIKNGKFVSKLGAIRKTIHEDGPGEVDFGATTITIDGNPGTNINIVLGTIPGTITGARIVIDSP